MSYSNVCDAQPSVSTSPLSIFFLHIASKCFGRKTKRRKFVWHRKLIQFHVINVGGGWYALPFDVIVRLSWSWRLGLVEWIIRFHFHHSRLNWFLDISKNKIKNVNEKLGIIRLYSAQQRVPIESMPNTYRFQHAELMLGINLFATRFSCVNIFLSRLFFF